MSEITIPKEAWNEAKAVVERYRNLANLNLEDMTHAACLAMLKNWPGMKHRAHGLIAPSIILPLTEKPE